MEFSEDYYRDESIERDATAFETAFGTAFPLRWSNDREKIYGTTPRRVLSVIYTSNRRNYRSNCTANVRNPPFSNRYHSSYVFVFTFAKFTLRAKPRKTIRYLKEIREEGRLKGEDENWKKFFCNPLVILYIENLFLKAIRTIQKKYSIKDRTWTSLF